MPTFERELAVWRENRQAFAAAVDATDWTLVAAAYQDIIDLPEVAEAGRQFSGDGAGCRKRLADDSTMRQR